MSARSTLMVLTALSRLDDAGVFTLDGEATTLLGLVEANAEDGLDASDLARMAALEPGDQLILGGGAGAEFILARVR